MAPTQLALEENKSDLLHQCQEKEKKATKDAFYWASYITSIKAKQANTTQDVPLVPVATPLHLLSKGMLPASPPNLALPMLDWKVIPLQTTIRSIGSRGRRETQLEELLAYSKIVNRKQPWRSPDRGLMN